MAKIVPGRVMHQYDGELVVFHIGMTFNRWWRPDLWIPVGRDMRRMLRELSEDPDSGLLGYELLINGNGPYLAQYWSSIDKLYDYASAGSLSHRPAWTRFNAMAKKNPGAVGIWHETFIVERAESMYVGTPAMGLPGATKIMPVEKRHHRARARLEDGATTLPASPADRSHPTAGRTD
ncbi:DUF4188 domain-containing protein [Pseudonocardia alaniniphila]|uniref:DUF4188 domain-containing protein n=1 Tax=Pseudonocardia alaniniphila TaxID=75291 RepID=A0ABS9TTL8_9PSEU|nr:DUF4188 domain-containing protein [Pseudonocardia alaniniphila]MCH6171895.1 DUF4188 domain-containing protein [Pseudonocardia alaniniphila]